MNETMKSLVSILAVVLLLCGCSKEERKSPSTTDKEATEETDTPLTPEENLSTSLVQGILGIEDDPDLESFIEDQLYPELKGSKAITMERLSASIFMIEFESNGQMRSYILRKFYDPQKDEYYFEKTVSENEVKKQFLK
jgi:PBP1b-binding outer membrane lipoprotein LpoB